MIRKTQRRVRSVCHFGPYRCIARICVIGFATGLLLCEAASAEERNPAVETRLGVVDIERVLDNYWRTPRMKAEAQKGRTSEVIRQKQKELADLEAELASQRFRFFGRKRNVTEIEEKKEELRVLAEKEAERARISEERAVDELLADIQRAAESAGREGELTAIFDSNMPQIIFLNTYSSGIDDVTGAVIEKLSSQ